MDVGATLFFFLFVARRAQVKKIKLKLCLFILICFYGVLTLFNAHQCNHLTDFLSIQILAMYNGIGLNTPRGSGTNGFVQRNFACIKNRKERVDYKTDVDLAKLDKSLNKQPNKEILEHQWKRAIELKCVILQDKLEEQG